MMNKSVLFYLALALIVFGAISFVVVDKANALRQDQEFHGFSRGLNFKSSKLGIQGRESPLATLTTS